MRRLLNSVNSRSVVLVAVLLLAAAVIFGSNSVREAWAYCYCCPVVGTDNNTMFGQMMRQLVKQTIEAKYKEMLAQRFTYEYLVGMITNYNSANINFDNLLNFTPQISGLMQGNVAAQTGFLSSNMSLGQFSGTLNSAMSGSLSSSLNNAIASGGEQYTTMPSGAVTVDQVVSNYNNFLSQGSTTGIYSGRLNTYTSQMGQQLRDAADMSAGTMDLATRVDVSQSVAQNSAVYDNLRYSVQEATTLGQDGVRYVNDVYGWDLRQSVQSSYGDADLVRANSQYLNNALWQVRMVCNANMYCTSISSAAISDMIGGTNNAASTATDAALRNVSTTLNNMISSGYQSTYLQVQPTLGSAISTTLTHVRTSQAGEFAVQRTYEAVEDDVSQILGDKQFWVSSIRTQNPTEIKQMASILAGPNTPDEQRRAAVKRLVAGKRAQDVARNMQEFLKGMDITKVDSRSDDQAWKDAVKLYYYWNVLQNEQLKLQGTALMATALAKEPVLATQVSVPRN